MIKHHIYSLCIKDHSTIKISFCSSILDKVNQPLVSNQHSVQTLLKLLLEKLLYPNWSILKPFHYLCWQGKITVSQKSTTIGSFLISCISGTKYFTELNFSYHMKLLPYCKTMSTMSPFLTNFFYLFFRVTPEPISLYLIFYQ